MRTVDRSGFDLPLGTAQKFEVVVSLKTARAIGIEVPTSLLLGAER
jgi:hypothetical protein